MSDLRFLRELGAEFERVGETAARRGVGRRIGGRWTAGGASAFAGLAVSVLVVLAVGAVFLTAGHLKRRPGAGHGLRSSLAGASVHDLSWVSSSEGFALAVQPCGRGVSCARVGETIDGGRSWRGLPYRPAEPVTAVAFASPTVGYLYGPGLLTTTDGGRSWQVQHGPPVETLAVSGGNVYRVAYHGTGCPGPCHPTLQEARIGSSSWRTLIGQLVYPDRSGSAQIVASGSNLLVALYGSQAGPLSAQAIVYRSTDGGASWKRRADPCSGRGPGKRQEEDLLNLAAAPGRFLAGLCGPHVGASHAFVVTSADGGGSWKTTRSVPVRFGGLLAAASPSTLVVSTGPTSGGGSYPARLFISTDGGRHWRTAVTDTQRITPTGVPAWLGFQTSRIGRWIGDPSGVWTTTDGGSHWAREAFP